MQFGTRQTDSWRFCQVHGAPRKAQPPIPTQCAWGRADWQSVQPSQLERKLRQVQAAGRWCNPLLRKESAAPTAERIEFRPWQAPESCQKSDGQQASNRVESAPFFQEQRSSEPWRTAASGGPIAESRRAVISIWRSASSVVAHLRQGEFRCCCMLSWASAFNSLRRNCSHCAVLKCLTWATGTLVPQNPSVEQEIEARPSVRLQQTTVRKNVISVSCRFAAFSWALEGRLSVPLYAWKWCNLLLKVALFQNYPQSGATVAFSVRSRDVGSERFALSLSVPCSQNDTLFE